MWSWSSKSFLAFCRPILSFSLSCLWVVRCRENERNAKGKRWNLLLLAILCPSYSLNSVFPFSFPTTVLNHPQEIKKVPNDLKSVPKLLVWVVSENQTSQIGPLEDFEKISFFHRFWGSPFVTCVIDVNMNPFSHRLENVYTGTYIAYHSANIVFIPLCLSLLLTNWKGCQWQIWAVGLLLPISPPSLGSFLGHSLSLPGPQITSSQLTHPIVIVMLYGFLGSQITSS